MASSAHAEGPPWRGGFDRLGDGTGEVVGGVLCAVKCIEETKLSPGEIYELDVEAWPTSIVVPKGYRVGLTVRGRDYEWPGGAVRGLGNLNPVFTGVGAFKHDDARDRPAAIFGGDVTLHAGPDCQAYLLLPIVPPK